MSVAVDFVEERCRMAIQTKTTLITRISGITATSNTNETLIQLAFERGDTGSVLRIRLKNNMTAVQVSEQLRHCADILDVGVQQKEREENE